MKKKIALFVFIGLIIISSFFLVRYILFTTKYATSDAAFVKSNTLTYLSFKLLGKLDILTVHSGDTVKKNELIAKLNTKELNTTLKEIDFNIIALQNKITASQAVKQKLINNLKLNIELNHNAVKILNKNILSLSFVINSMYIKLLKLHKDMKRYKTLYKYHKTSLEHLETIQTAYKSLKNQILSKQNSLVATKLSKKTLALQLQIIKNQKYNIIKISKTIASLFNTKSAFMQKAKLINEKIANSYIYAPFNGTIAKKFVNNHEVVSAGENIVSEVNLKSIYVSVLLEESKLKSLKIGNNATVHIDALDKNFKAKISKILPASASTFAIVPRDISSGEFTKLQQRFIVKLKFVQPTKSLLVGMSAEVTISR